MNGSGYEVACEELRTASRGIARAVAPFACYHLPVTKKAPEEVGHVELASILGDFAAAIDQCVVALAEMGSQVASRLDQTADTYESVDGSVADTLVQLTALAETAVSRVMPMGAFASGTGSSHGDVLP